ncbi:uncharacterized protein LOC126326515 [Schistocerca gregaria]|uniref:uncharacterized protein LOC126326515 n=1 Tax=Schistocerca gregaria TaxID=7010 RepID=UPI00211E4316|nr:uncharacterized protein LOC126326515 [Schistocerca gregaria]
MELHSAGGARTNLCEPPRIVTHSFQDSNLDAMVKTLLENWHPFAPSTSSALLNCKKERQQDGQLASNITTRALTLDRVAAIRQRSTNLFVCYPRSHRKANFIEVVTPPDRLFLSVHPRKSKSNRRRQMKNAVVLLASSKSLCRCLPKFTPESVRAVSSLFHSLQIQADLPLPPAARIETLQQSPMEEARAFSASNWTP